MYMHDFYAKSYGKCSITSQIIFKCTRSKIVLRIRKWYYSYLGHVWLCCLTNNFRCLNNITRISTKKFHSHVFPQHLKNITKTTLQTGP